MKYYFLGICGTAMASLAVLLKQKGHEVWGTDQNVYPPMSQLLQAENILLWEGYDTGHMQKSFDMAVIGNSLSRGNPEVETILDRRLPFASMTEIIRTEFAQPLESIVVTGTHGKTTTTALMAWVMECAGLLPTFLIGGISRNFDTSARLGNGKYFVVEGDEYDSAFFDKRPKFLNYFPTILIINNIEFDHADIYSNIEQIEDGFRKLVRIIPRNGLIIANGDNARVRSVVSPVYSGLQFFGQQDDCEWSFRDVVPGETGTRFSVWRRQKFWREFHIPLFGEYQVYNSLAVIAAAHHLGIEAKKIQEALSSFKNVKRRLEPWGDINGAPFYDDFAHHPTAIAETLLAVKQHHPKRRLIAVFEPRTNTTVTNRFQAELSKALAKADLAVISPLNRAERIPAEKRLSLDKLKTDLQEQGKLLVILEEYSGLFDFLDSQVEPNDVMVLMTNGNFGGEYSRIRDFVLKSGK